MSPNQASVTVFARRWVVAVAVAVAALLSSAPARASLILNVSSVSVASGTTGASFDVTLTNTGPSASPAIGAFSFSLTTSTQINFTGVTISTSAPYIFGGLGFVGPNITATAGPGAVSASDFFSVIGSGTTLGPVTTVGLGHVVFNAGAAGVYTVTVLPFPATSLSDTSFPVPHDIPITTLNGGTITVTPTGGEVPEPATLGMGLTALIGGALVAVRKSRNRRVAA